MSKCDRDDGVSRPACVEGILRDNFGRRGFGCRRKRSRLYHAHEHAEGDAGRPHALVP
jgi:hypothetical protein